MVRASACHVRPGARSEIRERPRGAQDLTPRAESRTGSAATATVRRPGTPADPLPGTPGTPADRDELPAPAVLAGAGPGLGRQGHRLAPSATLESTSTRTGSNGVIAATIRRARVLIRDLLVRPCRASAAARRSLLGARSNRAEPAVCRHPLICGLFRILLPHDTSVVPHPATSPRQASDITRGAIRSHLAASGRRLPGTEADIATPITRGDAGGPSPAVPGARPSRQAGNDAR
jgi:hypothetical protein